jgi:hypothetical protein
VLPLHYGPIENLVPPLGIEPSSTMLQTVAMTTSAKAALAGHEGIEPPPTVSKTVMISISPMAEKNLVVQLGLQRTRPYCMATREGFEPPTFGFGDQRSARLNYRAIIWSTGWDSNPRLYGFAIRYIGRSVTCALPRARMSTLFKISTQGILLIPSVWRRV